MILNNKIKKQNQKEIYNGANAFSQDRKLQTVCRITAVFMTLGPETRFRFSSG